MTDDELSSQHRDPREGLAVDGLLSATIEGWRLIKAKPIATTDEVDEIRRTAGLLGRWFAHQSEPAAVLQTMGVRV